jgi:hypothetical protein
LLALPALPLITACVFADEILFARRYGIAFVKGRARPEVGAMSTAAAAGRAA